ncbi:hypothetical protein Thermo_00254 [Thermoplasmatales archaeon]|nr:hypothetical protein Thermo_00254 [Thermoplasmatales archaeon]
MQFNGEFEVAAPINEVYSFLSDIDKIIAIIPDLLSVEKIDANSSRLSVKAGLSFIKGKFNLLFEIKDRKEDESVAVSARGSGSGSSLDLKASYALRPVDAGKTAVSWNVEMTMGGMVASMGSRVLNGAAEKYIKTLTASFQRSFEDGTKQ